MIFKTADFKQLNADALEACDIIGVKPESLQMKTVENFAGDAKEPAELAQVRLAHYLNKRKRKFYCPPNKSSCWFYFLVYFVENIIRVFNQITLAQNTPQY